MARKRSRQQSSNGTINTGDTSESDGTQPHDKTTNGPRQCSHVAKSVVDNFVKKSLNLDDIDNNNFCQQCSKSGGTAKTEDVYICLRCGSKSCSVEHSKEHRVGRSDPHDLALNLNKTSVVWCHGCGCEIDSSVSKKLAACVSSVVSHYKKHCEGVATYKPPPQPQPGLKQTNEIGEKESDETRKPAAATPIPLPKPKAGVKGLVNLGNTCFFNSVLQCLAQTPGLIDTLRGLQVSQPVSIQLKGGTTLSGSLLKQDPFGDELANTLSKILGAGPPVSPLPLLNLLRTRVSQFKGSDQHDSHELLRHLLESVRSADLKRYRRIMLKELGLNGLDGQRVDPEKQKELKQLDREVTEKVMLVPDQVFRGFLVSRLECQECHHSSECVESFLDLSLPVTSEKPHPPCSVRRAQQKTTNYGGATAETSKGTAAQGASSADGGPTSSVPCGGPPQPQPSQLSKHQLKKERRLMRKKNRGQHGGFHQQQQSPANHNQQTASPPPAAAAASSRPHHGQGEAIMNPIMEKDESDAEGDVDSEESDKKTELGASFYTRENKPSCGGVPSPNSSDGGPSLSESVRRNSPERGHSPQQLPSLVPNSPDGIQSPPHQVPNSPGGVRSPPQQVPNSPDGDRSPPHQVPNSPDGVPSQTDQVPNSPNEVLVPTDPVPNSTDELPSLVPNSPDGPSHCPMDQVQNSPDELPRLVPNSLDGVHSPLNQVPNSPYQIESVLDQATNVSLDSSSAGGRVPPQTSQGLLKAPSAAARSASSPKARPSPPPPPLAGSPPRMGLPPLGASGSPRHLIPLTSEGLPDLARLTLSSSSDRQQLKILIRTGETLCREETDWLKQLHSLPDRSTGSRGAGEERSRPNLEVSSSSPESRFSNNNISSSPQANTQEELSSDDKAALQACGGEAEGKALALQSWLDEQTESCRRSGTDGRDTTRSPQADKMAASPPAAPGGGWNEGREEEAGEGAAPPPLVIPLPPPPAPPSPLLLNHSSPKHNSNSDDEVMVGSLFDEHPESDKLTKPCSTAAGTGEGEVTLQSCLAQFTGIELMTGSNSVGCEQCTRRANKGSKEGKTVYTMSTKQLLISEAPPVLILHIKRFQVHMSSFRKLSRHVPFPLLLDIAPFCKAEPVEKSGGKLLYSLYGIVEHSGNFSGGHYVAYVKVDDGWFHISDSYVSQVSEAKVLDAQAYLLFYKTVVTPSQPPSS